MKRSSSPSHPPILSLPHALKSNNEDLSIITSKWLNRKPKDFNISLINEENEQLHLVVNKATNNIGLN